MRESNLDKSFDNSEVCICKSRLGFIGEDQGDGLGHGKSRHQWSVTFNDKSFFTAAAAASSSSSSSSTNNNTTTTITFAAASLAAITTLNAATHFFLFIVAAQLVAAKSLRLLARGLLLSGRLLAAGGLGVGRGI